MYQKCKSEKQDMAKKNERREKKKYKGRVLLRDEIDRRWGVIKKSHLE